MKVTLATKDPASVSADLLVIAVDPNWTREVRRLDRASRHRLIAEAKRQDFAGLPGHIAFFQSQGSLSVQYVLLLGLSDPTRPQAWFDVAQAAVARAGMMRLRRVAITALPSQLLSTEGIETCSQGAGLAGYSFQQYRVTTKVETYPKEVVLSPMSAGKEARAALQRGKALAAAACYARDLANHPADTVTPTYLADEAKRIAGENDLRVHILDEPGIRKAGMGALLGVGRGSAQPPRFIELIYKPAGKATRHVALVGKGITFDTGGLSLKTAASMESQKRDMAGGAAVLATMTAVRQLGVRAEVRAYVPAAENMPGGKAIKPGDVLRAANGKTIEVLNTDAEGRLVLADALSRAVTAKPDVIVDLATLTAAVRMALGPRYAAIMGTQPELVKALIRAGNQCDEQLWELPLVEEYRQDIASSVADIKNTGEGSAGTIIGGLFLREFVGGIPWAHIDFSSTVIADKPRTCHPRGATGFGVRTLLEYLRSL